MHAIGVPTGEKGTIGGFTTAWRDFNNRQTGDILNVCGTDALQYG